jgi:hypothetical protein
LLLSFATKNTSTDVAANVLYSTSYSIDKSEKDGTSIISGTVICVIEGKSFTAINLRINETACPCINSPVTTSTVFLASSLSISR